jgi:hypothetical protein
MTSLGRNFLKLSAIGAACFLAYFLVVTPFNTASENELQSKGDPFAHSIQDLSRWSIAPQNSFQPPACYYESKNLCQWSFFLLPFIIFLPAILLFLQEFLSKYLKSVTVITFFAGALLATVGLFLFEELLTSMIVIGIGHGDGTYAEPPTIVGFLLFAWFVFGGLLVIRQCIRLKFGLGATKTRVQ